MKFSTALGVTTGTALAGLFTSLAISTGQIDDRYLPDSIVDARHAQMEAVGTMINPQLYREKDLQKLGEYRVLLAEKRELSTDRAYCVSYSDGKFGAIGESVSQTDDVMEFQRKLDPSTELNIKVDLRHCALAALGRRVAALEASTQRSVQDYATDAQVSFWSTTFKIQGGLTAIFALGGIAFIGLMSLGNRPKTASVDDQSDALMEPRP